MMKRPASIPVPMRITAIILAAGANGRIKDLQVPKFTLPLTPQQSPPTASPTFLTRQLYILDECGVSSIAVVANASTRRHIEPLQTSGVEIVVNVVPPSQCGSSLSLLTALKLSALVNRADNGLLVLDADIVYEHSMMEWIVARCSQSTLFVTAASLNSSDEVRVFGQGQDRPLIIGKGLDPSWLLPFNLIGGSLGIIYIDRSDVSLLRDLTQWLVGWHGETAPFGFSRQMSEHEEIWQYMMTLRRLQVAAVPAEFLCIDCDTVQDYRRIATQVFPEIQQRDKNRRSMLNPINAACIGDSTLSDG